jgi:hypothetical protein
VKGVRKQRQEGSKAERPSAEAILEDPEGGTLKMLPRFREEFCNLAGKAGRK